jgi:hypothetical protein
MANQTSFTRGEWDLLGDAPLAACAAIALSEPGGGEREADAVLRGWREAADLFPDSELIQALVRELDPGTREATAPPESPGEPTFDAIVDEALDLCRRAVDLLAGRAAPEEIEDYQRFVLHLARRVAGAAAEGGVFGLGGEPVSRAERAVLREIADALGYRR